MLANELIPSPEITIVKQFLLARKKTNVQFNLQIGDLIEIQNRIRPCKCDSSLMQALSLSILSLNKIRPTGKRCLFH